jgi:hypothetical protein
MASSNQNARRSLQRWATTPPAPHVAPAALRAVQVLAAALADASAMSLITPPRRINL